MEPEIAKEQIITVLKSAFKNAKVQLDQMAGGRYSGIIIWDGFEDQDSVDRQDRLHDALTSGLQGEASKVGIMLAYTPHEMRVMKAA